MKQIQLLAKFGFILFCALSFYGCAADIAISPRPEAPPLPPPRILPEDLRVLDLGMNPDPVREGQRIRFNLTISNLSNHSGKVNLFIRDRDELVAEADDILLRPGHNQINFPTTGYRFSRHEHCFGVEVDIERTRRPIDVARRFCVQRTAGGWTLSDPSVGPFFIEDLEMYPDPVRPKQETRFKVKLRNDGKIVRATLRIQDRDEMVTKLEDVPISRGYGEYQFPYTGYSFQRSDHCFTVVVDVEKKPYQVEATRKFCARQITKPPGWTLQP
jgi:hypothetical protein